MNVDHQCPSCGFSFPTDIINKHANECLDNEIPINNKRPRFEKSESTFVFSKGEKEIDNEKIPGLGLVMMDEIVEKKKREDEDREYALKLCRSEHQNSGVKSENDKKVIISPQTRNDVVSQFQKNLNSLFDKNTYGFEGNWTKENGKIIVKIKLDPPKDLLNTFQRMKAMIWGVPDLTNAIFFLEIILDSEYYLEYSVPPKVTFIYQPQDSDVGPMKLIVEKKLGEYLLQQWMDKLKKIEMKSPLDVEKQNLPSNSESPFEYLCNLGYSIDQAIHALTESKNDLSKAIDILKPNTNEKKKNPEGGSISNGLNIWDRDNFFFNLINITHDIMTISASNCTICSNTLPKEPQAVVCDLCIAVYSVPFINPAATGSTVRILDSTHPDDAIHLSIVHNAFKDLKPIYSTAKYKITKVEYHVNPVLERQYEDYLKRVDNKREMFLWHGTADTNIKPIMKDNFKLNCLGKNSGNRGYYGAGIYFSSKHIRVVYDNKVLLCKVIVGSVYYWPTSQPKQIGCGKMKGFDSHYSGEHAEGKDEFVIFDMERILPSYVIHVVPY